MSSSPTVFCQHCGQSIPADSRFCSRCGQTQPERPSAVPPFAPTYQGITPAAAAAPAPVAAPSRVYAGFWMRFIAMFIDGLVVGIVTGPISMIVLGASGVLGGMASGNVDQRNLNLGLFAGAIAMIMAIDVTAKALYEAWLTSSSKQATVGKMIFRIKVTDMEGRRVSFGRALGRHFGKYISGAILCIGYIMQAFTEKRQALHDMLAGTLVVREVGPPYAIVPPQPATTT